jgi:ribose/xylose/arabinose/galactoside ABC-type transport system permease subunit
MRGVLFGLLLVFLLALVGGVTLAAVSQLVARWLGLSPLLVVVGAVGIFLGLAVHFAADHVVSSLRRELEGWADWLAGREDDCTDSVSDTDSMSHESASGPSSRHRTNEPPDGKRRDAG